MWSCPGNMLNYYLGLIDILPHPESLDKQEPCDITHCHVERRDQSFAVAERAER